MFQQHHGESLSEARTHFKDLLQKVPHHGVDLWLQVQIFYDHVNPVTRRTIDQSAGGKLRDRNTKESWALLEDLILYDNESWNDLRDFAKPVKAIALPQNVPSTSDRRLIDGPHDTLYCMEDPEQAFVEYTSSRTDEAGGLVSNFMASQDARLSKFEADFKQQQTEMTKKINTVLKPITDRIAGALPSDTVKNPKLSASPVLSTHSYLNLDPQCLNHVQGSINAIIIYSKKQSDSYDEKAKENEEEEKDSPENIHVNPSIPLDPLVAFITKKVLKFNSFFESLGLVPQSSDTKVVCTKGDDGEVMFIELIRKNDDSSKGEPEEEGSITKKGVGAERFNIFSTRSELAYHKLSQVVLALPFVEISNMTHDSPEGIVRFTNGTDEVAYKMPYMIEQYNSLSDLEKEHTKLVYLRNEEDKRSGVEYVKSKILGFYKECLELGPEYETRMDNEGKVT
ncbi:hypothetical protein Tco_0308716 [Tanacetum coccineum]